MSSIALQTDLLNATLPFVAVKDIRFYLCGVLIEVSQGRVYAVACDGHTAAITYHGEDSTAPDGQWIIPTDQMQAAIKVNGKAGIIGFDPAKMMLGVMAVTLHDGVYPDWRRIMPIEKDAQEIAQLNPEYVTRMTKVAKALGRKPDAVRIHHNGASPATCYVDGEQHRAVFLISPLRGASIRAGAEFKRCAFPHGERLAEAA